MKNNVGVIFFSVAFYIFFILAVGWLGLLFFPVSYIFNPSLPLALANWDGGYYLSIAQSGYQNTAQFAFLPLYSSLIYIFDEIINNSLISGLFISWGSLFVGLVFLFKLVRNEYSEKVGWLSLIYLLLFPTSFYLIAVYSESLFLMLTVLTFYFLQRQKKYDLLLATLFTSLALVTRIFGLGLLLALWSAVLTNKQLKYKWVTVLAPLTVLGYIYYLHLTYQNPLLMVSAQANWNREVGWENINIFSFLGSLWSKTLTDKVLIQWLEYIFFAFGIGLVIRIWRQQKLPYVIYTLVSFLIILISGSLMSVPRYLIVVFPLFIALATWRKRYPINLPWRQIYLLISGSLLLIFIIRFINGYWVS